PLSLHAALPISTVSTLLSNSTPCLAQWVRQPWSGTGRLRSVEISLKILTSEGGGFTSGSTEKQRPWAWPGPWYGSWPMITTSTFSKGVVFRALKQLSRSGKITLPAASSRARKSANFTIYGLSNSPDTSPCQSTLGLIASSKCCAAAVIRLLLGCPEIRPGASCAGTESHPGLRASR